MQKETIYSLIVNHGAEGGFEHYRLDKSSFIRETAKLLKQPKRVFLGLGDFLEIGDYKKLLDSVFLGEEGTGANFEHILDKNNRIIAEEGEIPFSFFKLAVYFPDFLLKDVPTFCMSVIGSKSRLFPGAENFIKHIKAYNPTVLSAMPYEIAVELGRRLGLDESHVITTKYITKKDESGHEAYAGGIESFLSGDRKSREIERLLAELNLKNEDSLYIGSGESGITTFAKENSIAFNTQSHITTHSKISVYGSSIESLLVLFNQNGSLTSLLESDAMENNLPSLVVVSAQESKNDELLDIEAMHLNLQNNIVGQKMEFAEESFTSVEREIEITFGGSFVNIEKVRAMINDRMKLYVSSPEKLVREIYSIAKQRYKSFTGE